MIQRGRQDKSHARMRDRVLLALRAGEASSEALDERLGGDHSSTLSELVRQGLVERDDMWGVSYRLTQAGRAICPRWRDICGGS